GDQVELVIEPPEVVEDVLADFRVNLGVGFTRIKRPRALIDGKFQDLAGGEATLVVAGRPASAGRHHQGERSHQGQGLPKTKLANQAITHRPSLSISVVSTRKAIKQ